MERAADTAQPVRRSVKKEAQAIEVVQPRHKKRASAMAPFSTRTASSSTSPQTGFVACTSAVALASLPALRGFRKWSRTNSLNMLLSYCNLHVALPSRANLMCRIAESDIGGHTSVARDAKGTEHSQSDFIQTC